MLCWPCSRHMPPRSLQSCRGGSPGPRRVPSPHLAPSPTLLLSRPSCHLASLRACAAGRLHPRRLEAARGQRPAVAHHLVLAPAVSGRVGPTPVCWWLIQAAVSRARPSRGCSGAMGGGFLGCAHIRSLSFRSPAAGAALLHRPRRSGDESCRESRGDGFPGPAQLTPRERGLPAAAFLLQHAPAPLRTGGEGQVGGMQPEPPGCRPCLRQCSFPEWPGSHQGHVPLVSL